MTITKRRPRPRFLIITIIIIRIFKNCNKKDYTITRKKKLLAPRLRSDKVYPY